MKSICLGLLFSFILEGVIAQNNVDSLTAIVSQNMRDTAYFESLYRLGVEFERRDSKKAIAYFKRAIEDSKAAGPDKWTALSAIRLAGVYSAMGINDSAELYFEIPAGFIQKKPKELKVRLGYFTGLGIHNNRVGNYWEAIRNYEEVAKIDISVVGKENLAGNYINMSNVYGGLGMVGERMDAIFLALDIFEEVQNKLGLSFCYNALGNLYYSQEDYEKSEKWYQKSLDLRIEINDRIGSAGALSNLGIVMMDTDRFSEALEKFSQAKVIYQDMGYKENISNTLINVGKTYQRMGKLDSALNNFNGSLRIQNEISENPNNAFVLAEIGRIHSQLANKKNAEEFLIAAINKAKVKNDPVSRRNAYQFLSDHYKRNGRYKEALDFQGKFQSIADSLQNANLKLKLQTLETRYEFDKKEAEINLLKAEKERDQLAIERQSIRQTGILIVLVLVVLIAMLLVNRYRILNKARRQLEIEKMRSEIARDLHDDLGSTLSSINIISNMAASSPNGNLVTSLTKISEQSSRMMEDMSDIVWSINPNHDTLEQVVIKMKTFASEILEPKNITFVMEVNQNIKDLKLDVEKRKNLFLIFKESINNAAKYSEGSSVKIQIVAENGSLKFTIEDDGKGFDPNAIKVGNGLRNMESRAARINGKLNRVSAPGKGTSVTLEIPIT